jgi:hypothetical protein
MSLTRRACGCCCLLQVQWLDDVRFVVSSDKAKKYQSYR